MARSVKISVTVDAQVLADAKRLLKTDGRTLSAFVSETLADELRRVALARYLDDYQERRGRFTEAELAAGEAKLEAAFKKKRRARRKAA